jgi:hypothetical protein
MSKSSNEHETAQQHVKGIRRATRKQLPEAVAESPSLHVRWRGHHGTRFRGPGQCFRYAMAFGRGCLGKSARPSNQKRLGPSSTKTMRVPVQSTPVKNSVCADGSQGEARRLVESRRVRVSGARITQ